MCSGPLRRVGTARTQRLAADRYRAPTADFQAGSTRPAPPARLAALLRAPTRSRAGALAQPAAAATPCPPPPRPPARQTRRGAADFVPLGGIDPQAGWLVTVQGPAPRIAGSGRARALLGHARPPVRVPRRCQPGRPHGGRQQGRGQKRLKETVLITAPDCRAPTLPVCVIEAIEGADQI